MIVDAIGWDHVDPIAERRKQYAFVAGVREQLGRLIGKAGGMVDCRQRGSRAGLRQQVEQRPLEQRRNLASGPTKAPFFPPDFVQIAIHR